MNIARQIFNNQHCTTAFIDLFARIYKTNEKDHVFHWLCLSKVGDYYLFLRVCELANHFCVMKNDKCFDIAVNVSENAGLVNDMKNG